MKCADGRVYKGCFVPYKPNDIDEDKYAGTVRFFACKEQNPAKLAKGCTHFLTCPVTEAHHDWLVDHGLLSPSDKNWSPYGMGYLGVYDTTKHKKG